MLKIKSLILLSIAAFLATASSHTKIVSLIIISL